MKIIGFILLMLSGFVLAQSYAPLPGEIGSTAIHKDSSIITSWATGVVVQRGPLDITEQGIGNATFGTDTDAIGPANGIVVSFGDGGSAIVTFAAPIRNGAGADFAVFENGFTDNYIELAFVEVSSDGVNYFRFSAVSEAPISPQYTNFSYSDCRYFYNFAGKYRTDYGTPFDLEELSGEIGLDINAITHVKLIDVVGSVDPNYGTQDSQGNYINDPHPTAFPSCGFDLDAVAVLNEQTQKVNENSISNISIYPNPSNGIFKVKTNENGSFLVIDAAGNQILSSIFSNNFSIDITPFQKGIYILQVHTNSGIYTERLSRN